MVEKQVEKQQDLGKVDPVKVWIAGMGLDALEKGDLQTAAKAAAQLTSANPNPAKVLIVSLAADLGKVGDEAMARL